MSVLIAPTYVTLASTVSGVSTTLDTENIATTEDQWYSLRIECVGSDVTVWRSTEGELETEILSSTAGAPATSGYLLLSIVNSTTSDSPFEFDNVRVLADDLSTTTTFTVNDADELVSMAVDTGGTTYYEYDAWGRMTRKYMGTSGSPTFEATYEYKYDDKLVAVNSDFPDEGNVSYEYGSEGDLRSRTENGTTRYFNSAGPARMTEVDASGNLIRTYIGALGHIDGSNPATAEHVYYVHDQIESIRTAYSETSQTTGSWEYSPYGTFLENQATVPVDHGFTSEVWDPSLAAYAFYFRHYSPAFARWTTREPSGEDGPNLYFYALGDPIGCQDVYGLYTSLKGCKYDPPVCALITSPQGKKQAARKALEAAKKHPKKVGCEWHHVWPLFMGGGTGGENLVKIPAAYHQFITNEFRKQLPYAGKNAHKSLPVGKAKSIMDKVYKKLPIPESRGKFPGCK